MSELLDAARKAYNTEGASVYAEAESKHAAAKNKYAPKNLTDKQIREMVSLYEQGKSHHTIAEQFGVSHTTVRKALINAGVTMRPKGGGSHKCKPEPAPAPEKTQGSLSGIAMLGRLDCMIQETYGSQAQVLAVSGTLDSCELTFSYGGDTYTITAKRE